MNLLLVSSATIAEVFHHLQAELFHRDSIATTQQLYLRPEVRGWGAPVPYMEAIRRTISKQL